MPDPTPDEPRDQILRELESIAHRPEAEQERWLEGVRDRFRGHPQQEQIVGKFRMALGAAKRLQDARVGLARIEELLEADVVQKLNALLDGSLKLPEGELEQVKLVLYISLAGHFLANVRSRLDQPDAQAFIRGQMARMVGGVAG
jgi:hypothetical protein